MILTTPYFSFEGKNYDRQVVYKNKEAEVKFQNQNGDFIVVYRNDEKDTWLVVKFGNLEVREIIN